MAILMASLDAVIVIDHERRIIEFNHIAEKIFGYTRQEAMSKTLTELIIPVHMRDAHINGMARYLDTRQSRILNQTLELEALKADGTLLPVELTIVSAEVDDNPIFISFIRDNSQTIAQRERQTRQLHIEELNREIIRLFLQLDDVESAINESLVLCAQQLNVSRMYIYHLDLASQHLTHGFEWYHPEVNSLHEQRLSLDLNHVPSLIEHLSKKDIYISSDDKPISNDLMQYWFEKDVNNLLMIPIHIDQNLVGFLGIDQLHETHDWLPEEISMTRLIAESYGRALERQEAQSLLMQTRDEALQLAQVRSQFLANMSHEIRTPMTGILGMLELLLESELDELQREFANDAMQSSRRLHTLINDVLDTVKLQAGQIKLTNQTINIPSLFDGLIQKWQSKLYDKPIILSQSVDSRLDIELKGDRNRLQQILTKLGDNAVKFTEKGLINFKAKLTSITNAHVRVKFQVVDTGIGIEDSELSRIFESFIQADGSITRKYGGSGLGLTIAKQLIELMDGELIVDSDPKLGSIFEFTLLFELAQPRINQTVPTLEPTESKEVRKRQAKPKSQTKGTILIADDYQANRDMLKRLFSRGDIKVLTAENGREAIDILEKYPCNLVLMDFNMPVMDGREATTMIRQSSTPYRQIPIVALTAEDESSSKDHILAMGFNDIIYKPFSIKYLRAVVERWLKASS